ncbi:MAG: hypothetical protein K9L74_06165 [Candidatus Izimaplasma sp.]|nr:hypothetical protein [Candidatus Izimaplasma bacterium]
MKKKILIVLLMVIFFLSGCSQKDNNIVDDLEGVYHYVECIYLAPYSSSTLEAYPDLYGALIYIEFSEDQIVYYGNDEETRTYTKIEFRKENVNKDFDGTISLDFDGVFDAFDYRYDIYSGGTSVGLTIFIDEETLYIAETRMIGGSHDVFSVFSIVEIKQ